MGNVVSHNGADDRSTQTYLSFSDVFAVVNFPCSDQRVVCRLALNLLKNRT